MTEVPGTQFRGRTEKPLIYKMVVISVAVGTVIADRPPHRSVRAELPHTAPTLDEWRQRVRRDKDARSQGEVSIVRRSGGCVSN
jgi:hypothetical protein